jgi:hypothetical protein
LHPVESPTHVLLQFGRKLSHSLALGQALTFKRSA